MKSLATDLVNEKQHYVNRAEDYRIKKIKAQTLKEVYEEILNFYDGKFCFDCNELTECCRTELKILKDGGLI